MPRFETMPLAEAMRSSTTGKRAQIAREYLGYIDRLVEGQAGRLRPAEGETIAAVRRRLGAAARLAGKDVVIRRVGEEIYFWSQAPQGTGRRRGRRPRSATLSS